MHYPKKQYPSQHWFKRYIHYNPHTGEFTRIQKTGGKVQLGKIKSSTNHHSVSIRITGEWYQLNRIAWIYMTGEQPKNRIKHINDNIEDYKWNNLTLETRAGLVRKRGNRWNGYFYDKEQKQHNAGTYDTEEEALISAQAAFMLHKLEKNERRSKKR